MVPRAGPLTVECAAPLVVLLRVPVVLRVAVFFVAMKSFRFVIQGAERRLRERSIAAGVASAHAGPRDDAGYAPRLSSCLRCRVVQVRASRPPVPCTMPMPPAWYSAPSGLRGGSS